MIIIIGALICRSQVTGETCKQHDRFEETAQTTSGWSTRWASKAEGEKSFISNLGVAE